MEASFSVPVCKVCCEAALWIDVESLNTTDINGACPGAEVDDGFNVNVFVLKRLFVLSGGSVKLRAFF